MSGISGLPVGGPQETSGTGDAAADVPPAAAADAGSLLNRAEGLLRRVTGGAKPAPAAPVPATPEAKAQAIERLIGGTSGAVAMLQSHLPGRESLTDQVLDILKTCKGSAELDSVLTKVGRRNLLLGLHTHGAAGDPVKAYIAQVRSSDIRPGDWDAYNSYLDQVTGTKLEPGNQVTLLDNGQAAFPAMFDALDHATSSINVETFEFHDDATGHEYAQHLIDAAKRGVAVNVLMDAHGSDRYGGATMAALLRANGVNVIDSPPAPLLSKVDHRKSLVVDGSVGFTGGMNIGDDYRNNWHDMHSKIEGPAVADLQSAFLARWKDAGGAAPAGVDYFPPIQPAGDQAVRIVPHVGGQDENIRMAYLRAIDTAQSSIMIEDPYFVDSEVLDHLAKAARRGVDVKCVWPADNDVSIEQDEEHASLPALIAAGVKCYEYNGRPMAHEKVGAIDGKLATIGSSNLDMRSLRNNDELNAIVMDPKFAGDIQAAIESDIAKSTAITDASKLGDPWTRKLAALPLRLQALEDET
jgi:cardiolipin synthase